jgi:hypothetical protein
MMKGRWRGLFLLLATWILGPSSLLAQPFPVRRANPPAGDRPSHILIPDQLVTPEFAEEFLRSRIQEAKDLQAFEKLAKDLVANPERFPLSEEDRALLDQGPIDPSKPEVRDFLNRFLGQQKDKIDDPDQPARWQDLLKKWEAASPTPTPNGKNPPEGFPPGTDPTPGTPAIPDGTGSTIPFAPPPSLPPFLPPGLQQSVSPSPNSQFPAESSPNSPFSERLRQWAEGLRDSPLGESPTIQKLVADLARSSFQGQLGEGFSLSEKWQQRFRDWGKHLPSDLAWPNWRWSPGRDFWSGSGWRSHSPPVPFTDSGSEGMLSGVLIVGGIGLGAFSLWLLFRSRNLPLVARRLERWRLGPWPVSPAAVQTRDELVRAFEYLALLLLGPVARSWNHRLIADRMAGTGSAPSRKAEAAERLAGLYERARYAPADEILREPALRVARQDLSFLAGTGAS